MFERALVIRAEFLEMILDGIKTWEMRTTHTKIRGAVGLIEAGSGQVMGVGRIVDSIGPLSVAEWRENVDKHKVPYRGCEALAERWKYAWVFDDVKRLSKPLKYCHPKGAVIWVKFNESYWK